MTSKDIVEQKKKLLVTSSTFPRWDDDTVPPFVFNLCKQLSNRFDVHVLAPHCAGAAKEERIGGIRVFRYQYAPDSLELLAYSGGILNVVRGNPLTLLLLPALLLGQLMSVRRLQKLHKYDVIHAHWIVPQGLVMSFSKIRVPWLLTAHGGDLYALNTELLRKLKSKVLRAASLVSVVSSPMVEECKNLGVDAQRIKVRSMGVDTKDVFKPPVRSALKRRYSVLFVGRLVDKKGAHVLINAIKYVVRENIPVKLKIVGDGPERQRLEAMVDKLDLRDTVEFVGALKNSDLVEYYQRSEVFVLASVVADSGDQEGLGLVTVEAMACGCCVVAADLPAVKDVVTHNMNGILYESGCSEQLGKSIVELLSNTEQIFRLSCAAVESVETFDWSRVGYEYGEMLQNLVAREQ